MQLYLIESYFILIKEHFYIIDSVRVTRNIVKQSKTAFSTAITEKNQLHRPGKV